MPVEVMPGYYTIGGNSTTRSSQLPCPPGSYCNKGIMRECPAGRYGSSSRLTTAFALALVRRAIIVLLVQLLTDKTRVQ